MLVPNYQNESALARLGTGNGGLTNTSTPTGAQMRIWISPLTPGDSTEIQPGNPEIAMSAKAPDILLTDMTCVTASTSYALMQQRMLLCKTDGL